MQSQVRKVRSVTLFAALLLCASALLPIHAHAAQASMTVEVPAGQYRSLRMRNVQQGDLVAVAIETKEKLAATIVSEADYRRYPKPENPLFVGQVEQHLSFTVTVPQSGHYFLVFDNRSGAEPQQVKFVVRAGRPRPKAPQAAPETPKLSVPQTPGPRRDQF